MSFQECKTLFVYASDDDDSEEDDNPLNIPLDLSVKSLPSSKSIMLSDAQDFLRIVSQNLGLYQPKNNYDDEQVEPLDLSTSTDYRKKKVLKPKMRTPAEPRIDGNGGGGGGNQQGNDSVQWPSKRKYPESSNDDNEDDYEEKEEDEDDEGFRSSSSQGHSSQPMNGPSPSKPNRYKLTIDSISNFMVTTAYKCTLDNCTEQFNGKENLFIHWWSRHGQLAERCLAPNCSSKGFSTREQLAAHLTISHPYIRMWHCSLCCRPFQTHRGLLNHHWLCHHEGEYHCIEPTCNYSAIYPVLVQRHSNRVHTSRHFICDVNGCGKAFKQAGNFKMHQRFHSASKPYQCKWGNCDYASETRSNAMRHVRTVHFGLPVSRKEQKLRGLVETRKTGDYIQVVLDQLKPNAVINEDDL